MADNLVVVRGDTPQIVVGPVQREGVNVNLAGASAIMTVRRKLGATVEFTQTATFNTPDAEILVDLDAADTVNMAPGNYIYDIQLTESSGKITTFPDKGYGKFKLVADVTTP
jgi:hypothetical protein